MVDQLLAPLNWVSGIINKLLEEEIFNEMQRTFLYNIATEVDALRTLLLTVPDTSTDHAKELLSYEGRSHLASIIGYLEELLDEVEGELSDTQRDLLFEVRSSSMQLLSEMEALLEN